MISDFFCVFLTSHYPLTLGVLPKIPFTLTQSIHVALQKKTGILTKIGKIINFLTLKTIKGKLGFILKLFQNKAKFPFNRCHMN